jgi:hypothetical protein
MKNKIFNHKLIAVGTFVALGLGASMGAQAASEAYAVSIHKVTNTQIIFVNPAATPAIGSNGEPAITGELETISECSTDLPAPNDIDGDNDLSAFAVPPGAAPLDAEIALCNIARVNNAFDNLKDTTASKYGSGDAEISDTDIASGTASMGSLGESFTNDPILPPPSETFSGGGRNSFSFGFVLREESEINIKFSVDYLTYVELKEAGFGSVAVANSKLVVTITDLDETDPALAEKFVIEPTEVNTQLSISQPDAQGNNVFLTLNVDETSPSLPAGNYEISVANEQGTSVKLTPFKEGKPGDHYLCYKSFGHFLRDQVDLVDQFNEIDPDTGEPLPIGYDVLKPKMFCNPAIKPIRDPEHVMENPDAHLLSYKINEAHRQPRHERQSLIMRDQFFDALPIQTIRPDRLMVPSGKSLDGTVPAQVGGINHFKCYRVRPLDGFQSIAVNVADQFTDPDLDLTDPLAEPFGKDLVLVRPTRMCTPVQKTRENGEVTPIVPNPNADPADPRDHLMCYRVKTDQGARLNRRTEVTSSNQFRDEDLVLKRELEFCAPASKTVITGTGG